MNGPAVKSVTKATRVFKTSLFAKSARKDGITDDELCRAVREVMGGQFSADLGGGVYKKRLNKNMHRSIILAKCGERWVYEYLFAKNERDNIDDDEKQGYKLLAKTYGALTTTQLDALIANKKLLEICHDRKKDQSQERKAGGHARVGGGVA